MASTSPLIDLLRATRDQAAIEMQRLHVASTRLPRSGRTMRAYRLPWAV